MFGIPLTKIAKPLVKDIWPKFQKQILEKKKEVELEENEKDVCLLIMEKNDKVIFSFAIFDKDDKITRYVPLNDTGVEALELDKLLTQIM